MPSRPLYAIAGLFVAAAVNLLLNLIAAALQQRAFLNQFSEQSLWWLAGLAVTGLLVGYWLGGPVSVPATAWQLVIHAGDSQTVTITRLRALLSYTKLRGKGIHLSDILLIGSRLDIDTKE